MIAIRGFGDGVQQFDLRVDGDHYTCRTRAAELAIEHAVLLQKFSLYLVEIEFLDEPPENRFLRVGTDKARMKMPIALTDIDGWYGDMSCWLGRQPTL